MGTERILRSVAVAGRRSPRHRVLTRHERPSRIRRTGTDVAGRNTVQVNRVAHFSAWSRATGPPSSKRTTTGSQYKHFDIERAAAHLHGMMMAKKRLPDRPLC